MWDTAQTNDVHLSHDMRCARCGHDLHTFLACGAHCACEPVVMPGAQARASSPCAGLDDSRNVRPDPDVVLSGEARP